MCIRDRVWRVHKRSLNLSANKYYYYMLAARYRKAKGAKVGPARAAAAHTKAPAATLKGQMDALERERQMVA